MVGEAIRHAVRPAGPESSREIGRMLARAFFDDPIWCWLIPDPARREPGIARVFGEIVRQGARRGLVLTTAERAGAAVWWPPDAGRPRRWEELRIGWQALRAMGTRSRRAGNAFRLLERLHPEERHHYLRILGTDPAHQGTGVGSALLRPVLCQCDREGVLAYLETATESNVAFYRARGFELRGSLELEGGGPRVWRMERRPARRGSPPGATPATAPG